MSELFSGQSTRSGCGCAAGGDVGGQVEGLLHVVVEHGPPLGVEVQPEPRHVALDDRDGRVGPAGGQRRAGQRQPGQRPDQRDGERRRPRDRRPHGSAAPRLPRVAGRAPGAVQGERGGGQQGARSARRRS